MDALRTPLVTPDPRSRGWGVEPRLDARARAGELVRVRRAVYVPAHEWVPDDRVAVATLGARAAQARASVPLVFSHATAALILGLPVVGAHDRSLHVTNLTAAARRTRHGIVWHSTSRPEAIEVQTQGDLTVTTPRQTALDLARSASAVTAFIVADAVAHRSGNPAEVREWWVQRLGELGPARGTRRAASVLGLVTGLAESPLESLSLLRMHELGFHLPEQQIDVLTRRGLFRLDFGWEGGAIAGEADGRSKYGGIESAAQMEQRLWEEKLRHDAVREKARAYPRWTWDDAWLGSGPERALLEAGVPRPHKPVRLSY
ncbi:MAG: hypothetical protein KIT89_11410 [Microcella sp.]|uniref:hypothetical protein n=1 Tax=Microcella sp. TaxID=1913979 RepID=UPI0024CB4F25|nr:hypothetical protein [Microcella sp.]UYN83292.1 MAG: hypothetical protein KIT89_11410 [Microcella sp.]